MSNNSTAHSEKLGAGPSAKFDYGSLDEGVIANLEDLAAKCASKQENVRGIAAQAIIDIGCNLDLAQQKLAGKGREGLFRPWLEDRCRISKSSAYKAIAAYKTFGKCPRVDAFEVQAMYLLSTDSCPEAATKEAIKLAKKTVPVTAKIAREIIAKHSEPVETKLLGCAVAFKRIRASVIKIGSRLPLDAIPALTAFLRTLAGQIETGEQPVGDYVPNDVPDATHDSQLDEPINGVHVVDAGDQPGAGPERPPR